MPMKLNIFSFGTRLSLRFAKLNATFLFYHSLMTETFSLKTLKIIASDHANEIQHLSIWNHKKFIDPHHYIGKVKKHKTSSTGETTE